MVAHSEVEVNEQKQIVERRLRVFPLSLSPSCVTQKKTTRKKWPREILGGFSRIRVAIFFFFLVSFFRVTLDVLSERGTTRSLHKR